MKSLNDDILYDIDNSINNELAKHRIQQEREKLDYEKQYYIKEIERLKSQLQQKDNIIKEIKSQLDYLETYSSKEDVFEDMKRRLNNIEKIIDKENK